jgi:hypothetical protein
MTDLSSTTKVYATAIGLVIWFAVAAWILFDHSFGGPSEVSLPLAIVSVLLLIAVLLPFALSLVWKRHRMLHDGRPNNTAFREWSLGDFAVWGSKIRGMHAAIDMLLPLAAVAFGLTGIGIVFLICASLAR